MERLDHINQVYNDAIEVSDEIDAAELQTLIAIRIERINIGRIGGGKRRWQSRWRKRNLLLSESGYYPNSGQYRGRDKMLGLTRLENVENYRNFESSER